MERMARKAFRRTRAFCVMLFVSLLVVFLLMRVGSLSVMERLVGPAASDAAIQQVRQEYGLDQPTPIQFAKWTLRVLQGDLGRSWTTGKPVLDELLDRLPASLELLIYGSVLGMLIGVPLGVVAGFARGRAEDSAVRLIASLAQATPVFYIGLMLLLVFFAWFDLSPPPTGRLSLMLPPPPQVTGSMFIDAVLVQDATAARSALAQLALPLLCVAVAIATPVVVGVRAIIASVLGGGHIAHARAQGLPNDMVASLVLRAATAPVIRLAGRECAAVFGAVALVEFVFSWGGIGQFGLDAMVKGDVAAAQGCLLVVLVVSCLVVLGTGGIARLFEPHGRRA